MKQIKEATLTVSRNRKAFLIRFWREHEENPWRVTLQAADSGEKHHFQDLDTFTSQLEKLVQEL